MTRDQLRNLIIAFWVFIVVMLLWQFYSYNQSMTKEAVEHPVQTKFIFLHTNAPAAAQSMAHSDAADVQQVKFVVQPSTPSPGSYTCLVTLKNVGRSTATGIQICIRPYRGTSNYDEDVGHQHVHVLDDDDPTSLFSDWLSFPDLAPGESATRPDVFSDRTDAKPGRNPNPQIIFETVKSKPGSAPATPASTTPSAPAPTPPASTPDAAPSSPPPPSPHHGGA